MIQARQGQDNGGQQQYCHITSCSRFRATPMYLAIINRARDTHYLWNFFLFLFSRKDGAHFCCNFMLRRNQSKTAPDIYHAFSLRACYLSNT